MRSWTPLCALIAIALPGSRERAQGAAPRSSELEEADRKALETIAGHSEPLRDAVLKASLHVDALVETQRIQEQSSASFQERIGKLDKKQQEQIWEIVREPGLLDELATEERPSRSRSSTRSPSAIPSSSRPRSARWVPSITTCSSTSRRSTAARTSASTPRSPISTTRRSRRSAIWSTSRSCSRCSCAA